MDPVVQIFLLLTVIAPVSVMQAWIANGRPKAGAFWVFYSAGPLAVVLMAAFIPESFLPRQGLIDGFWGLQLAAYLVGAQIFTGRAPSKRIWLIGPIFALVSGVPYYFAPGSVLASVSGAVVISAGYLFAAYRLSPPGRKLGSGILRTTGLVGGGLHAARFVTLVIAALALESEAFDAVNAVSGAVTVLFVIYHAFAVSSLIQRRSFEGLITTSRKLDRTLFERQNTRLIASVAHRISTPVAAIRAIGPLLRDKLSALAGVNERERSSLLELVSGIDRANDSLAETLRQYQALSLIPEDEDSESLDVVDILQTLTASEHMSHLAVLIVAGGARIPVTGPPRRTLQLFAVLLEQQRLLGWSNPDHPLQLSVETDHKGPFLRISGMDVDPALLWDLDRINQDTRLDMVSAARAMSYAWNQLRELYTISNQASTDPVTGKQCVIWRFGALSIGPAGPVASGDGADQAPASTGGTGQG